MLPSLTHFHSSLHNFFLDVITKTSGFKKHIMCKLTPQYPSSDASPELQTWLFHVPPAPQHWLSQSHLQLNTSPTKFMIFFCRTFTQFAFYHTVSKWQYPDSNPVLPKSVVILPFSMVFGIRSGLECIQYFPLVSYLSFVVLSLSSIYYFKVFLSGRLLSH
jgi:hypothetical protein